MDYYLILHRCLNIGTSIVTVRAVTERDKVEFRYSPDSLLRYELQYSDNDVLFCLLKGLAQAEIIKKSVILFRVLNMTI